MLQAASLRGYLMENKNEPPAPSGDGSRYGSYELAKIISPRGKSDEMKSRHRGEGNDDGHPAPSD